ncbi:MAG: undecaprenyl-diphosphatase [Clostridia bacterium]|nr:undecaprenyl-diphosphatase [Clostridia bacterium]
MTYIEAIIFGVVQGITEALPISSTAHIVITELILGYHFPGLAFEIFLHQASALAVILYYRRDLAQVISGFLSYLRDKNHMNRIQFFFGLYIIVATVITGGLGVLLKGLVVDTMKTPAFISGALIVTGFFLVFIERFHKYGSRTEKNMTFFDAIVVGLAQTFAVLPGISRSGATLVSALWLGLSRETAVRYSFLLVIPVILGSSVLILNDTSADIWAEIGVGPMIVSFITTYIFSVIGIVWLIDFLRKSKLVYFAAYCFIVAILVYLFLDPTMIIE